MLVHLTFAGNPAGGDIPIRFVAPEQAGFRFEVVRTECCGFNFLAEILAPCPQLHTQAAPQSLSPKPCVDEPYAHLLVSQNPDNLCEYPLGVDFGFPCMPTDVPGPQGPPTIGPKGPPGFPGGPGPVGPTGPILIGPTGAPGFTGPTGFVGPVGPTGPTPPGPAGFSGSTGPTGFTGPAGPTFVGPMGLPGPQGVPGAQGYRGARGYSGGVSTGGHGSLDADEWKVANKNIFVFLLGKWSHFRDCESAPQAPPTEASCPEYYAWSAYKICRNGYVKVRSYKTAGFWASELNGKTVDRRGAMHPAWWGLGEDCRSVRFLDSDSLTSFVPDDCYCLQPFNPPCLFFEFTVVTR